MKTITIPYTPHPGQKLFHASPARFRVLVCGRRWGKDRATLQEMGRMAFKMATEPRPKSLIPRVHVWSVAPTFPMLRQTWGELKDFWVPTGLIKRKDEAELTLEFYNGIFWELKSADKPESLVGAGLDLMGMTEAARVKRDAWAENIRPTLSSPMRGPRMVGQGLAVFNTSPRGRNWVWELYKRGQKWLTDPESGLQIPNPDYDPAWESWQMPTSANPHINPNEITAAQKELPHNVYLQEYEAQFLDESAGVFVNVSGCSGGTLEEPVPGRAYAVGVDLAYMQDWTVITVLDVERRHVVYWERLRSPLWADQEPNIIEAAQKYNNAPILIDRTGVGQTAPEMLRAKVAYGHTVEGYFFTSQSKQKLITDLQMAFQNKQISYPAELTILAEELRGYEYTYTTTGRFAYSAPEGQHDDSVISLGLALQACNLVYSYGES